MTKEDAKNAGTRIAHFAMDVRVIITALALLAGGTGMKVFGGPGVNPLEVAAIADSVSKKDIAPVIEHLARQDTAIMQIKFSLDVMMSNAQKLRADSLMRSALKNINYGAHQ